MGSTENYITPYVGASFKIEHQTAVYAGLFHSCARTVDNGGSLKCWGKNDYGQLGANTANHLGDNINEMGSGLTFLDSTNFGHTVVTDQIYLGRNNTCIIDSNNDLHCWGRNDNNQLGTPGSAPTGSHIGDDEALNFSNTLMASNVLDVGLGENHSCIISGADNRVYCVGTNDYGQLGAGADVPGTQKLC